MSQDISTFDQALALLKKFNQNENLIKHALAVAGSMRHFAQFSEARV